METLALNIRNGTLHIESRFHDFRNFIDKNALLVTVLVAIIVWLKTRASRLAVKQTDKYYSKIPTAPSIPILGCLPFVLWNTRDIPKFAVSWTQKYGSIFRTKILGTEIVTLNNPKYLQTLLWSTVPEHLEKPGALYRFLSVLERGLTALKVPEWKIHRSVISQAFTYNSMVSYLDAINRHSKIMISNMQEAEHKQTKLNVGDISTLKYDGLFEHLNVVTFKIISEIIVGSADIVSTEEILEAYHHVERLARKLNAKYIHLITDYLIKELMVYRLYNPWLMPNIIWKRHAKSQELDLHYNKCLDLIMDGLARAKDIVATTGEKKSILSYLVEAKFSDQDILAELVMHFGAGHDTTSGSLNFLMFNLAIHPHYQEKCREEVDRLFHKLEEEGSEPNFTMNDLAELKYVEQCIKESLRLFPTVPFYAREIHSPLKLEDDLEIKAGTIFIISPYVMQRSPEIYPNPEIFDPDRFLAEECAKRGACSFNPFSYGPRNCIGWKLAMIEMKILAAFILRHFEVTTETTVEMVMDKLRRRMWPYDDLGVQWNKRRHH